MKINDYLVKEELAISAYGTSEGANKGWDSRGRGRAKKNFEPPSSVVRGLSKHVQELAKQHKPHDGMCNLNNPVCKAYVDMRIHKGEV